MAKIEICLWIVVLLCNFSYLIGFQKFKLDHLKSFNQIRFHKINSLHQNGNQSIQEKDNEISPPIFFRSKEEMFSRAQNRINLRRFISFNLLAVFIAIGANFLGITSFIMTNTNPNYFSSIRLDQLYSINGFRRNVDTEDKYQFVFPDGWLIDQSILVAKERERELPRFLKSKPSSSSNVLPDVAYGPPGTNNKENVSVVKSLVLPGFTLAGTLGTPMEAAEKLLQTNIAPSGSGKEYELVDAKEEIRQGYPSYIIEYIVKNNEKIFNQHVISVITSRDNELFTLTSMAPNNQWKQEEEKIKKIVDSFQLNKIENKLPNGFY